MKVVIIGGVAGGASAAARLRRLDEQAEIVMLERTGYVSYANCGLPYYVGGIIAERGALALQTPESFRRRFNIDVRVNSEVTAINREAKTVSVREVQTGRIYEEPYDKLILAPGAAPVVPAGVSLDSPRVFTLRTVEDALALRTFVEERAPRRAVVVGGGFIGIEAAENLVEMSVETTLVQRPAQLLKPLDPDMAAFVHAEMRAHGVRLVLGGSLEEVTEETQGLAVRLRDGAVLGADLLVLAIGVAPEAHLAAEAGLALGSHGGIATDEAMRTSDPDIFAAGDAVEVTHGVTGGKALVALAGPANKQGRIVADAISGRESRYGASWGSSVIKVFDLTVASTGLNETAARVQGIDCDTVILSPGSHAGYYPGARPLTMKVVFERGTLRLLGAQIVGAEGVDKRIDVLACAMQLGADGVRLKDLDLAYAPPYSSAKDPVNMAGFMIENVATGLMKQASYDEIPALRSTGATLLDVRTEAEWDRGHIDGFVHIPLDELRDRLGELPAATPVYVTCQSGLRSYVACRMLAQHGFDAYNFRGGYGFYRVVAADGEAVRTAATKEAGMALTVKRFHELSLDEYHEMLKLRCAVFVVEQQSPYQEVDDADKEALHLWLRDGDGALAAYARVLPAGVTHPTASIGRVIAVTRGTGAGRRIMEEAIRLAQDELGADIITIEAQVQARGFYEKLGFVQTSDEFDDGGIPHIEMRLTR